MVSKVILFLLVGVLAGSVAPCAAQQYAITDPGVLLPGSSSQAAAVNRHGEASGFSYANDGRVHAVAFRQGTVIDLGHLGYPYSQAFAINSGGDIVGVSTNGFAPPRCCQHAFLYRGGTMSDLGTLGGDQSLGYGINDRLQIVGEAQLASRLFHAFLFNDGRMIDLGAYNGNSRASAINSLGQIVGTVEFNTYYH